MGNGLQGNKNPEEVDSPTTDSNRNNKVLEICTNKN
jgi:hypothetical protein